MDKKMRLLPFVVLLAVVVTAFTARSDDYDEQAKGRKADYIYLEAARQDALSNSDAAYVLYNRVLTLNPDDEYAGLQIGEFDIRNAQNREEFEVALDKIRQYCSAHPEDMYVCSYFGRILLEQNMLGEALPLWEGIVNRFPKETTAKYYLANTLFATMDSTNLRRGLALLDTIGEENGEEWLMMTKLKVFIALRDTTSILNQTRQMINASPNDANTLVTAGKVYVALNDNDSALMMFQRACKADSTDGFALYTLANFHLENGDSAAFENEIFNALTKDNLDVGIKTEMLRGYVAEMYATESSRQRILDLFETLVEMHPHEAQIHFLYGQYFAYLEQYPKAAEQLSYAVDTELDNEYWTQNLVTLTLLADSLSKAEELGEIAMKNFPDNSRIPLMTASAYFQDDKKEKAVEISLKAAEHLVGSNSEDHEVISSLYQLVADIYQNDDLRTDSLVKYYDLALLFNPDNLSAMNNYAYALAVNDLDLDKAEKMSAVTVQKEPDNVNALDTYAWIFFKKRDYKLAKEYIDRTMLLDSGENPEVFHHAGDIYFMNGDPESALKFWRKALELEPDNELLQRKVKHKTYFYN